MYNTSVALGRFLLLRSVFLSTLPETDPPLVPSISSTGATTLMLLTIRLPSWLHRRNSLVPSSRPAQWISTPALTQCIQISRGITIANITTAYCLLPPNRLRGVLLDDIFYIIFYYMMAIRCKTHTQKRTCLALIVSCNLALYSVFDW